MSAGTVAPQKGLIRDDLSAWRACYQQRGGQAGSAARKPCSVKSREEGGRHGERGEETKGEGVKCVCRCNSKGKKKSSERIKETCPEPIRRERCCDIIISMSVIKISSLKLLKC